MNKIIENGDIRSMIYEIRGKQVMLDSDLAKLYEVETGALNRQVKRNIERFDYDFMFQLTLDEYEFLKCQNGIANTRGGRTTLPYVFTEQGVAMLISVLKSKKAIDMSKKIMRAFVAMRHYISSNVLEQKHINNMVLEHEDKLKLVEDIFSEFNKKEFYFDKTYDAYSKVIDIFKSTKKELIIIDRYTDKTILDMIKDLKYSVILITGDKTKLKELDIKKYNESYNNLKVIYSDIFHDRYFIIDKKKIYHSGNSINHIGYRKSSINLLEDKNIKNAVLNDVNKVIIGYLK